MKHLLLLFAMLLFLSCKQHLPLTESLFQIEQDGKTGFIDNKGRIVIKPVFHAAGNFSEGLAPARLTGTYGYIDASGNWVIPPQFDYAVPFSEGLAVVYKNAVPFYINLKGEKAFACHFEELGNFEHGRAMVKTASGKIGIIDQSGKLFVDTAFSYIRQFIEGLAVVVALKDTSEKESNPQIGIIDSTGKFVVTYGKYYSIEDYEDGLFKVEIPADKKDTLDRWAGQTGFVNTSGRLVMSKTHQNQTWLAGYPNDGLIKTALYKYWIPEEPGTISTSDKSYMGFADLKGNIVIDDTAFRHGTDFSNNRAFVEIRDGEWNSYYRMIDRKGRFTSDLKLNRVDDGFVNGFAIVQTIPDWKWA